MPTPDGSGEAAGGDGSYVMRDCTPSGGGRVIMWIPNGAAPGPAGVPTVIPDVLAQEARNLLRLPLPAVGVSPDGANENPALVNLPTWWWVANAGVLTQRTAVGPVWAEVTAEPVSSAWVAGDGGRSDCAGLGIAWRPGSSESQPGSCRHTYSEANAEEQAQIQVTWRVTWVGSGGSGGTLTPMTMTMTQAVPVYERQAIVTGGG